MNFKSCRFIIGCIMSASSILQAGDKPTSFKDIIDELKETRRKPAQAVQQDFETMVSQFKTKKWLTATSEMNIRAYNDQDKKQLKETGSPSDFNLMNISSITKPSSMILVDPKHHEFFSAKASQGILGHEIAHTVIKQNALINPYYWMFYGQMPGVFGIYAGPAMILKGIGKNSKKMIIVGAAVMIGGPLATIRGIKNAQIDVCFGKETIEYNSRIIRKFIEIECDFLSAMTHPEGAIAIKEALQAWQVRNTKINITSSPDHPKLPTRIAILNAIERIQAVGKNTGIKK